MAEDYAKMIKQIREQEGITQLALATKFGVHENTVNRWERGEAMPQVIYRKKMKAMLSGETHLPRKRKTFGKKRVAKDSEESDNGNGVRRRTFMTLRLTAAQVQKLLLDE
jgi:ribosome-binding protein aMBF1 (putative translation factor)